ncbi:hypothetical protein [Cellulomonas endometrii]|uniref:hypothetical protein n=1 Tax=Cellulomonas endometrii TaxID=3036301 RepID=UPI0024ACEA79|nr:hypothetical protein [Cellulomonas endometrii]
MSRYLFVIPDGALVEDFTVLVPSRPGGAGCSRQGEVRAMFTVDVNMKAKASKWG